MQSGTMASFRASLRRVCSIASTSARARPTPISRRTLTMEHSTSMPPFRVLVSGAGVAGPALTWWLSRAGAQVTVLEKVHAVLPHGQNIDLSGTARDVVDKMGLKETILAHHTTEKGTIFVGPHGEEVCTFPVEGQGSLTSDYEILRGDLVKIFYEASKDHPNAKFLFDTTIKEVISNDEDCVKVELSNGGVQEYDLLVACDGQWSKLRTATFPPEVVKPIDRNMTAIYWTLPRIESDNGWWNIYSGLGSRLLSIRPDAYGNSRACITYLPVTDADKEANAKASRAGRQAQQELVRKIFAGSGWQTERLMDSMEQSEDFYFQVLQTIQMEKWWNNRIVCLGDTAYAPTPLTGMGTSLAVTGSYVLAGELSRLRKGDHPAQAFEAYDKTFRPFVTETQSVPWGFPGLAHPYYAWHRYLLFTVLRAISWFTKTSFMTSRPKHDEAVDFPLPVFPDLAAIEVKK